jgi:outer membrane protein, heavy metal efflux system
MNKWKALFTRSIGGISLVVLLFGSTSASAQQALTWDQVKAKFEAANPVLRADAIGVDEAKAEETTAFLRPNPDFNAGVDGVQPFTSNPYRPFTNVSYSASVGYLWERDNKRNLRHISAEQNTAVTAAQHTDLERNLLFTLRGAFVQALQSKAMVEMAQMQLDYYDKLLDISRARFQSGDIARVDLDRLELQRVEYESDLQTADVSLRTAKIQLLQLLNDRTPVDQFSVEGEFDYVDALPSLDEVRQMALDNRPDLKAALVSVDEAKTNHKLAVANGSTDPTWTVDVGYARSNIPPIVPYIGLSVDIPLRIFDRNQGEKLRTKIDIDRQQRLVDANQAQVFNDVDSAHAMVNSNLILLRPYKQKYLDQALRVRDTITYSYQHGGASLLDLLNAQSDYRTVQLSYMQLIGSYLTATSQLNLAVGREVIP